MMKCFTLTIIFCVMMLLVIVTTGAADNSGDSDKTLSPYFFVKSADQETDRLPLLLTSAEVNIAGTIADVTVTQIYKNEGRQPLEAIYVFPASTRAAVYGMTMTIGERHISAKVQERQKARQHYEQAVEEGKTASLLEQQRPNVFQMNVANILPGDHIKVELRYTELLVPSDGVYEFVYPTVVGPRYSHQSSSATGDNWVSNPYYRHEEEPPYLFNIMTKLSTGMPIQDIACPSHEINIEYTGPGNASITLDDTSVFEQIRMLKPDHLQRVQTVLKELYIGEDFGNLPQFYGKLFRTAADSFLPAEKIVTRTTAANFGGDRDYILRYRLAGEEIQSGLLLYNGSGSHSDGMIDDENFFLLMLEPPERVAPEHIPPREYIFIVDVSGSMEGFPLNTSKQLLRRLIGELRPTDTFNVLLFAGSSSIMSAESVPANRSNIGRAIRLIDNKRGGGGTELLPALKQALALPKSEGTARTIVIATDGLVDSESEAFELIRHNRHNANIFAFGIGSSVNRFLIEGMARAGSGEPFVVTSPDKASEQAEKFRSYVQSPVLTGIECDFGDFEVYDVEPGSIPDLLAERPVVLFGKWRGNPRGSVTLSGFSGAGAYQQRFELSDIEPKNTNSALRYLWARKRIEILGDADSSLSDAERVQAITNLSLTYNLLSQYTSFVAIDETDRRENNTPKNEKSRQKKPAPTRVKQPLPAPKGVAVDTVSTPEPTTIVLVGLGLIGILTLGRRRIR